MTNDLVPFEEDERRPRIETLAIAKITQDKEIAARDLDFDIVSEYWERLMARRVSATASGPGRPRHPLAVGRLSSPRSGMPEQARKRSLRNSQG